VTVEQSRSSGQGRDRDQSRADDAERWYPGELCEHPRADPRPADAGREGERGGPNRVPESMG